MSREAYLKSNYIQVVRQSTQEITYGGDQGFFKDADYSRVDQKKNQSGCGVVALADTILYLMLQTATNTSNLDESYVNCKVSTEATRKPANREECKLTNQLLQEDYKIYYNKVYDFVGGVSEKLGANGLQLATGFNRFARRSGWKLRSRWGFCVSRLCSRIEEMLQKDIPVILCIPTMLRKKDREKGITFLQKEDKAFQDDITYFRKTTTVNAHFVVITGIITENEETYLQISSWGKKYFINWKEYEQLIHNVFLGTILGNILYIK